MLIVTEPLKSTDLYRAKAFHMDQRFKCKNEPIRLLEGNTGEFK